VGVATLAILVLLTPVAALADGGGPLLLLLNGPAFFYGSILIVVAEWGVYYWQARIPAAEAFMDALVVNSLSTVVIGFLFPMAIAAIGMVGTLLPGRVGQLFLAVGTWIYSGSAYPRLAIGLTLMWFLISFLLTVAFETRLLSRRWASRGVAPCISARRLSWRSNVLTYTGLAVVVLSTIRSWFG